MNVNLPGPGQGTLGQNSTGAFPQQFNKVAPQEMAMRQKVMVGQAVRPQIEPQVNGPLAVPQPVVSPSQNGPASAEKTVSSEQVLSEQVSPGPTPPSVEPQIQQFQPNKSMVFGKSVPSQSPQSPGTPLIRPGLARLNPVYILAGASLLLWSLFWLNYFGILYLGEYLPFLPVR